LHREMKDHPTMSIAVLDKTFSILEVMARTGRPLPLAELAQECRMPKPTVYRILRSLRDLGYVMQRATGGDYELSDRLGSLRTHGRDAALRAKAEPIMTGLHVAFDETVNLGVLEGIYVRYAAVRETTQALRWIVKPGARDPFHTTALGRAIVAQLPDEQRSRLVAKAAGNVPRGQRAPWRSRLERELAATRRRGYALEEGETVSGVACVATSLAHLGEPLAAISVSVPLPRFPATQRSALIHAILKSEAAAAAAHG
jgi:DNA-binding IclR family transcriptional regulator